MAWNYDPTDLETDLVSQVRLRIGDTVASDPQLQDEEIEFFLSSSGDDVLRASLRAVNALIAKASSEISGYTLGPYSESSTNKINNWRAVQQDLSSQVISFAAPVSKPPTTSPIFNYDMMSKECCEVVDES